MREVSDMFLWMFEILGLWLVAFFIVSGVGLLSHRLFLGKVKSFGFLYFWIGYCALIMLLQIYHLMVPINSWAFSATLVLSVVGWYLFFSKDVKIEANRVTYGKSFVVFISVTCVLWLANRALHNGFIDDTGLYHFGVIKWVEEYRIIPGLGNLHGRLAFNNANLLFNALFDHFFGKFGAVRLANGLLITVIFVQAIYSAIQFCFGKIKFVSYFSIALTCYIPVIFYLGINGIGMSTDIPNFIVGILASCLFLDLLFSKKKDSSSIDTDKKKFQLIILLASTGVCIKLSFVIFGFFLCMASAYILAKRHQAFSFIRECIVVCWIPAILIGVYMIRGYILSGYPLYPSTVVAASFDWTIPQPYVDGIADGIKAAARMFGWHVEEILTGWKWIVPWVEQQMLTIKGVWVVLLPLVGSIALVLSRLVRIKSESKSNRTVDLIVGIVFLSSAVFWFYQAPTPRFAGIIFWFYFIYSIILIFYTGPKYRLKPKYLVFTVLAFVFSVFSLALIKDRDAIITLASKASIDIPSPKVKTFTTDSGLILYTSDEYNAWAGLTWDAPLPATPNPKKGLILRDPNDMSKGFKIIDND